MFYLTKIQHFDVLARRVGKIDKEALKKDVKREKMPKKKKIHKNA